MTETSLSILAKDVDGDVEDIVLDLLARIVALEARPAGRVIAEQTVRYEEGPSDIYRRVEAS